MDLEKEMYFSLVSDLTFNILALLGKLLQKQATVIILMMKKNRNGMEGI